MLRVRIAKMWRPSAAELVVLLLGIACFICSEAARSGPGTGLFSGGGDASGIFETMMVRPSLQRKILEEGQSATPNWTESKLHEQEKKWEPTTEDKPKEDENKQWESQPKAAEEKKDWSIEKPKEDVEKKWDSQPKIEEEKKEWKPQEDVEKKWDSKPKTEEEKKEWKPQEDVEKKWDSQPKTEEEKKEWKPQEDVEKKWDSQPNAEEEKKEWKPQEDVEKKWDSQPEIEEEKKEWKPEEHVEKTWDSQPKAEEEKKEWVQEQPKKDEVAVNPHESKSGDTEPIKVEETKQETWQNQEPKTSEIELKVEERKEETWQNQERIKSESEQLQVKVEETKEKTWQNQNQEPKQSESEQQQIKVEEAKEQTWQNEDPKKSENEQEQITVEEKEAAWYEEEPKQESEQQTKVEQQKEQQPWKPAEEWKAETKEVEKVEEPKAEDGEQSENQWQSNNPWEEKPREVTKVEEKKEEPPKVEDRQEEPNQEDDIEFTTSKQEEISIEDNDEFGTDLHSDLGEDYPDFLDELRNFPERFQKTAESVKDHIRYSGLDKYSTQSKELFNQASQQIQESFTPLLGKDYAPFLAYLVSYGLLLLPLLLVTYLLDRIRARYSLQKILLFMNIYLSAYFAALLTVALVLDTEPMNFFMKYSTSSYIFLQLLQAFGYLMYLLLNTVDLISTCSNGRIAAKFSSVLQWVVVVAVGFHYYVTVFHRAMARKAPLTSWKIYGFYSLSFIFLCLFARIERGKKEYTPMEVDDTTDKKN